MPPTAPHMMHSHNAIPRDITSSLSSEGTTLSILDRIARSLLLALFALIPFFFIPVPWLTALQSKIILAAALIGTIAIVWTIARIKEGGGSMPFNVLFGAAALLPVVYTLSSAVNGFASVSLVGTGVESDTLAIICLQFAALAITAMVFSGREHSITLAFRSFFAGLLAMLGIQILHIVFPSLSLGGVLAVKTGNALGTWHEFIMLTGLAMVLSLALVRSKVAEGIWKWVVVATGILALPITVIGNFFDVWIAVSVALVVLAIVRWYQSQEALSGARARAEWPIIVLLVISLMFTFFGARIIGYLPERISVVQVEVRPSWQGTFQIGEQSLSNPLALVFGTGPNTFVRQWGLYKPIEVNQTPFWNADFSVGVAPIPTSFITTGILGVIAWIGFIVAVLWVTIRLWIRRREYALSGRVLAASIAVVYLVAFHLSSVPGTSLGLIMFLVTGLLLASITPAYTKERAISIAGGDWKNAIGIALFGFVGIVSLVSALGVVRAVTADAIINRAIVQYNASSNLQASSDLIALSLLVQPSNDRAHRSAVELGLLKLQQIIAQGGTDQEAQRAALQDTLQKTITHGLSAVEVNSRDYQNWLQLAALYSQLAGAQIDGAYANARDAYVRAQTENPTSPLPYLNLGQLDAIQGNFAAALENLGKAVQLKPDLAAAYYLASQIYVAQNDAQNALLAAAETARYAPNDPLAWYNAGAIAYAAGAFQDASLAMQQALALQPQYANALYILGLSLYQLGDAQNALVVFDRLSQLDPQPIVQQIIENLRAGRALDSGAVAQ
jgi:tetratricopeptide (TPR) repeat protein